MKAASKATTIVSSEGPKAIGPYSKGKIIDASAKMVFLSGVIAIDTATNKMIEGDAEAQTELIMQHIGSLLKAAGGSYENVVKCNLYLTSLKDFEKVNKVYAKYFTDSDNYPARVCIEVKGLPLGALVEIETTAAL